MAAPVMVEREAEVSPPTAPQDFGAPVKVIAFCTAVALRVADFMVLLAVALAEAEAGATIREVAEAAILAVQGELETPPAEEAVRISTLLP